MIDLFPILGDEGFTESTMAEAVEHIFLKKKFNYRSSKGVAFMHGKCRHSYHPKMPTVFLYLSTLLSIERHCERKSFPQNATH